jgi:hypothetical protein
VQDLEAVLDAFSSATGCDAAVWTQDAPHSPPARAAGSGPAIDVSLPTAVTEPVFTEVNGGVIMTCAGDRPFE